MSAVSWPLPWSLLGDVGRIDGWHLILEYHIPLLPVLPLIPLLPPIFPGSHPLSSHTTHMYIHWHSNIWPLWYLHSYSQVTFIPVDAYARLSAEWSIEGLERSIIKVVWCQREIWLGIFIRWLLCVQSFSFRWVIQQVSPGTSFL